MPKTGFLYTTDIHGSEQAFVKFLNAAKYYKVNTLIHGGDFTGKAVYPIIDKGGTWDVPSYAEKSWTLKSMEEVEALEKSMTMSGYYPYRTTPEGVEKMQGHPELQEKIWKDLMQERVRRWMKVAEERLAPQGVKCIISIGNDDPQDVRNIIDESNFVIQPEGKVIMLDNHEMISTGYANMTPWQCPGDLEEEVLAEKIEALTSQVKDMKNAIFNFHCPPYKTILDQAPRISKGKDGELKFGSGGAFDMFSVGSKSIKDSILKYQPLVALHGHIHEAKGVQKLYNTIMINPGSRYIEGALDSVLVQLEDHKVKSYFFVSG
ncbi:MAG: metallophosphoesterase [Candidatus Bathyarchaeota archaeon]